MHCEMLFDSFVDRLIFPFPIGIGMNEHQPYFFEKEKKNNPTDMSTTVLFCCLRLNGQRHERERIHHFHAIVAPNVQTVFYRLLM